MGPIASLPLRLTGHSNGYNQVSMVDIRVYIADYHHKWNDIFKNAGFILGRDARTMQSLGNTNEL